MEHHKKSKQIQLCITVHKYYTSIAHWVKQTQVYHVLKGWNVFKNFL